VLADIELAQTLKSETEKALEEEKVETVPHPVDQDYNSLNCSLDILGTTTKEYKVMETTRPGLQTVRLAKYVA